MRMLPMNQGKEFVVVSGTAVCGDYAIGMSDKGKGARVASIRKDFTEVEFQCNIECKNINTPNSYTIGLLLCYSDLNNYYLFIEEDGASKIVRKCRGVFRPLAVKTGTNKTSGLYKAVRKNNGELKFYRDEVLVCDAVDTTFTKGAVGLVDFGCELVCTDPKVVAAMPADDTATTITDFNPKTGVPGTVVTLTGNNFDRVRSVVFGGFKQAEFAVLSNNNMTVTVPDGIGDENIVLRSDLCATAQPFKINHDTVPLFELNGDKGVEPAELENDQNTSWAFAVVPDPLDTAKKCYRFECRKTTAVSDSQRSELKLYRDVFKMQVRKEYYFGFKTLLANNWIPSGDRWCVLFQIHEIPDHLTTSGQQDEPWRSPPLALMAINNKFKWIYRYDPEPISASAGSEAWDSMTLGGPADPYGWQGQVDKDEPNWFSCPLVIGKWVEWKVRMKWDWTEGGGILQIWKDGELVVDRVGKPIGYNDEVGGTVKWGLYRSAPHAFAPYQDRVVYHNDIVVSDAPI